VNKKIVLSNCLAITHPEIAKEWHPTKNKLTPLEVGGGSSKMIWWKCDKGDDHVWETNVFSRAKLNKSNCPKCPRKISSSNSLATTHPEIAKQWHPTKNGYLTPEMFSTRSSKRIFWICDKGDDHVWDTRIFNRTKPNRNNCPVCANKKIVLSNCLATTHPDIAKEWHPTKNKFTPLDVGGGSDKNIWWKCDKNANHVWEARIINRTKPKSNKCPVCTKKKLF